MEIVCVEAGPILTNCYIVFYNNKKNAFIVDTSFESADALFEILDKSNTKVESIILTHSHWDHAGDAGKIRKKTGAEIMVHKADEYRLLEPNENTVMMLPFELEAVNPDQYISDGEVLRFGDNEFQVLHTPGHTEGSISLVNRAERFVFTGDLLFHNSVGRTDLPGGSSEKLLSSIKEKIMVLDDDYLIYSGHGPKTTVGEERKNNVFLNSKFL
jgi:hydroxyacylglutathione hydrolase